MVQLKLFSSLKIVVQMGNILFCCTVADCSAGGKCGGLLYSC